MLKPIQLLLADRTQGNSFQSKITCAPACTSSAARRVQSLCQPCCAHHTPRSPCSFPGEIQNPLIPQGIMSLLHPLAWSRQAASACPRLSLSLKICPLRSPSETPLGFGRHWLGLEIPVQESISTFLPSLTMAKWWQDCPFYRKTHGFIFPSCPSCNGNKKRWNFSCCSSLPSKSELRCMKLSFLSNFVPIFHRIVLVWCLFQAKSWKQSVQSFVC